MSSLESRFKCSFCGKSQNYVAKLIAGPDCYICDGCVSLCMELVDEDLDLKVDQDYPASVDEALRLLDDLPTFHGVARAVVGWIRFHRPRWQAMPDAELGALCKQLLQRLADGPVQGENAHANQEVLDACWAAHARDPNDIEALESLACSLYRAGRHADAQAHYERLARMQPQNLTHSFYLAHCLARQGRPSDAMAIWRDVAVRASDGYIKTTAEKLATRMAIYSASPGGCS